MKRNLSFAAALLAAAALTAFLADRALTIEAAAECRRLEKAARTYGDVNVPEWCAQVPRP